MYELITAMSDEIRQNLKINTAEICIIPYMNNDNYSCYCPVSKESTHNVMAIPPHCRPCIYSGIFYRKGKTAFFPKEKCRTCEFQFKDTEYIIITLNITKRKYESINNKDQFSIDIVKTLKKVLKEYICKTNSNFRIKTIQIKVF